VNYADATRERLRHTPEADSFGRQLLGQRIVEQLEQAVAGHRKESDPKVANVVAHAQLTLAEVSLEVGDVVRARRALNECEKLPALAESHRVRLKEAQKRLGSARRS
jgi:hypothetical protein